MYQCERLQLHLVCLLLPSGSINSGVIEINKPLVPIYTELEHSLLLACFATRDMARHIDVHRCLSLGIANSTLRPMT
jgi:hypothetical protein